MLNHHFIKTISVNHVDSNSYHVKKVMTTKELDHNGNSTRKDLALSSINPTREDSATLHYVESSITPNRKGMHPCKEVVNSLHKEQQSKPTISVIKQFKYMKLTYKLTNDSCINCFVYC
jgi:hypothetical protein